MKLYPVLALVLSLTTVPVFAEPARTVAAVNAPLAYIVATLGGEQVTVVYPVPKDIDPAYWEPAAEDVQIYQMADLIVLNGAGYAKWVETEVLPRARLVDTTAAVRDLLIPAEAALVAHKHGLEGEHAHDGAYAFTTWLDPEIAAAQLDAIARAISSRWPEMAPEVEKRAATLGNEIAEMDEAFSGFFESISERQLFASHPVYQYLDRAYPGDITSLHWEPDADPGDAEWSNFERTLDEGQRPLMLWEDAPTPEIRDRLNGLGVEQVVLSPMANTIPPDGVFQSLTAQVKPR